MPINERYHMCERVLHLALSGSTVRTRVYSARKEISVDQFELGATLSEEPLSHLMKLPANLSGGAEPEAMPLISQSKYQPRGIQATPMTSRRGLQSLSRTRSLEVVVPATSTKSLLPPKSLVILDHTIFEMEALTPSNASGMSTQ